MKTYFTGLAVATLLVVGTSFASFAEDAPTTAPAAPAAPVTQAPAAQPDAPLATTPRPSLAPKAAPAADAEPLPAPRQRYARRHHRWHRYRTAYWEPFPIFWPHYYHHRIHWNHIPWFFRF